MALTTEERFFTVIKPQTPPFVGPATYYLPENFYLKDEIKVPFSTSAEARPELIGDYFLPAPCEYDSSIFRLHRVWGGEFSKALRKTTNEMDQDGAGPAGYSAHKPDDREFHLPRKQGVGKLWMCKAPRLNAITAPSVPTLLDNNGYDIGMYGNLIKNEPDFKDTTLGPAFYAPPAYTSYAAPRGGPPGTSWSLDRSKRCLFITSDSPGPAEYNLNSKRRSHFEEYQIQLRGQNQKNASSLRYSDIMLRNLCRMKYPGPGQYQTPPGDFDPKPLPKHRPRKRAPFNSSAKLHSSLQVLEGPGPAGYLPKDQPKILHFAPAFLSSKERFSESKEKSLLGPGSYSIENSLKCSCLYPHVTVPFGSSEKRQIESNDVNADQLPAPNTYYPYEDQRHQLLHPKASAIFVSKVPRSIILPLDNRDSYSASKAWHLTHDKCSHRARAKLFKMRVGKKARGPFETSEPRFGIDYHQINLAVDRANPGPAQMNLASYRPGRSQQFSSFSRAPRWFPDAKADIPGPNYYEMKLGLLQALD